MRLGTDSAGRPMEVGPGQMVCIDGSDRRTTELGYRLCRQAQAEGMDVLHLDPRLLPAPQPGFDRFRSVHGDPARCLEALLEFHGPGLVFIDHASRLVLRAEDGGWLSHLDALVAGTSSIVVVADPGRMDGSAALRSLADVRVLLNDTGEDLARFGSARSRAFTYPRPKDLSRPSSLDTDSISC